MNITDEMRADGWIDHDGGRNPVKSADQVFLMWRDGTIRTCAGKGFVAGLVPWEHGPMLKYPDMHIIAYKLKPGA